MSRVSVFLETFGECIREIIVGKAVNETVGARGISTNKRLGDHKHVLVLSHKRDG